MAVQLIDPHSGSKLEADRSGRLSGGGRTYPVVNGIPWICDDSNYTDNFGKQWNAFAKTQIDRRDAERRVSEERLFIETGWWRGPHVKRDYYRVLTQTGRRAWLFRERDSQTWFLHGWFD